MKGKKVYKPFQNLIVGFCTSRSLCKKDTTEWLALVATVVVSICVTFDYGNPLFDMKILC
jgi:hypothetical protein